MTTTGQLDAATITEQPRPIVVVFVISNLEFGGAQRQLIELVNNFDHDLFQVHICSLSGYIPLAKELDQNNCRLHIIEKRYKFDASVVVKLARLLHKLDAQIVQSYLFDAEIAARLASTIVRTPLMICSERNTDYQLRRAQKIAHFATKRLYDACIANSNSGAIFNAELFGQPRGLYHVIRNGVDTQLFQPQPPAPIRRSLGISEAAFCVGIFGSFKAQKNHPLLIEAIALALRSQANICLLFVGDELHRGLHGSTEYKDRITQLIRDTSIAPHCIFLGNRDDVADLYNACDITVLPSLFEGTPNVVLESLACGIPVIASNVSDNSDIIPDGRVGYIIELGDAETLAERICYLMTTPQELSKMKTAARKWAIDEFSTRQLANRTEDLFLRLLARSKT